MGFNPPSSMVFEARLGTHKNFPGSQSFLLNTKEKPNFVLILY